MYRKEGLDLIMVSGEYNENQAAPSNAITIKQVIERLKKLPDHGKFLGIYIEGQKTIHYAVGVETDQHKEVF